MSNQEKAKAKIEAAIKQMRENRNALTETAKAIHGEDYANLLNGTANIVLSIKVLAQEQPADAPIHEHLKSAIACVLTCAVYDLFTKRGIEGISPEATKLVDAFHKDIAAITEHGYKRIRIRAEDLEGEDE